MKAKSIGFVGTGAITEAMVRGLLSEPAYPTEVHLSPRNAEIAARLFSEFAAVSVAPDNQTVVDRSDLVVLAIRPQVAETVIGELTFKPGQSVVSIIAATEREVLLKWIAIYPPDAAVAAMFDALGKAVQCQSRKEYDLLAAASALMSTYFGIMEFATGWLETNGLERTKARAYLAPLFESLARRANGPHAGDFNALSEEFATRGGLNEQVLRDFDADGGKTALTAALDRVFARIEGR
jgi:pyrroline-5-carboxylate reductase